jgi:hypothetical protein
MFIIIIIIIIVVVVVVVIIRSLAVAVYGLVCAVLPTVLRQRCFSCVSPGVH